MIEGCKHGPKFLIPQPCADCERERDRERVEADAMPTRETHKTGSFWRRNGTDEMWQLWWQHATIRMRHVPYNEFIDVTPTAFGSQFKPWSLPPYGFDNYVARIADALTDAEPAALPSSPAQAIRAFVKHLWEECHDGGNFEKTQWAAKLDTLLALGVPSSPAAPKEWECICTHHYRAHDRFTFRCTEGGCECSGYVDGPATIALRPVPSSPVADTATLAGVLADLHSCVDNIECDCIDPPADDKRDDYDAHAQYCRVYLAGYIEKLQAMSAPSAPAASSDRKDP